MVDFNAFKTWVASQPSQKTYDYTSTGTDPNRDLCALGQYLKEQFPEAFPVVQTGGYEVRAERDYTGQVIERGPVPREIDQALSAKDEPFFRTLDNKEDWTFGQLAHRLELVDA